MAQQNSSPAPHQPGTAIPEVKVEALPDKVKSPAVLQSAEETAKEQSGQVVVAPRTMAQIESDMDATRERLTETINQLTEALQPKNIMNRQVAKVKGFYVDEYGAVRPERVAATVGAVVAGVVVIKVTKRIFS